ncbi:MAG TPA: GcrA family cell cycle regulator [Alphaproteobacteria bacterium]|nr:GcrA family cell cycle regulator [Alphaproteobacteria bacterium]
MSWTEERIERLRQLWGSGRSASEIAEILGDVSRNAVIGKAHRLGLSGRPSPIKVKRDEPAAPKAPVPEQKSRGATILSLTERMCRWPLGDPKDSGFRFCGKMAHAGSPYCAEHAAVAYQQPKKKEENRKAAG